MYHTILIAVLLTMASLTADAKRLDYISVVTEQSSFAYIEGGNVRGDGTELVEAVLKEAGFKHRIRMMPWARAYKFAYSKPNTLIYAISRTTERERDFHWLGKIMGQKYNLYRLKSRPDIAGKVLADFKKYRISGSKKGVTTQHLLHEGFQEIKQVANFEQELKLLLSKRVDLIVMNENSVAQTLTRYKLAADLVEPVLNIPELSVDAYFAVGKRTPDWVVQKLKSAYRVVVNDGRYENIMIKRLKKTP